jgi:DNA polymerase I-like protein with 3'-5' exonuclease and polymerase domains
VPKRCTQKFTQNKMNFIGLDIETAGTQDHPEYALQPYRVKTGEARITAISVVDEDDKTLYSQLEPRQQDIEDMLWELRCNAYGPNTANAVYVGWNTIFDLAFLIAYGQEDVIRQLTWADGMVMRRALENHSNQTQAGEWGLKNTVRKYLPEYADYEAEIKERNDWSVVDETLLSYNRADSYVTARVARIISDRLTDRERTLVNVVNSGIVPLANSWVHGIEINRDNLDAWAAKVAAERSRQLDVLTREHGLPDAKVLTSHQKLKTYLHQNGFPVECTDRNELTKYAGNPLMDAVLGFKKARGAETKFINGAEKSLAYNGGTTTHPAPRLFNTYTGRDGYQSQILKKYQTGISIHQWPKRGDTAPRMVVQAPKGFLLCECDFSTQESRLLADYSGDPVLLDIFRRDLDFHSYMAGVITNSGYESFLSAYTAGDKDAKEARQCAKVVNLSLTYRAGWKTLINMARKDYDTNFTESQAQEYHALYRATYRLVPDYWQRSINIAQMQGYAETRGARKVFITDWSRAKAWASEGTALNFPIQGTGADMKCLARGVIDPILYRNGGRYMLDFHDALFFLVPDNSDGEGLAVHVRDVLNNLPYDKVFNWKPKVPMPVGLSMGHVWGKLEGVK